MPLPSRHEEGLLLLRECLKSVRFVTGQALVSRKSFTSRSRSSPQLNQQLFKGMSEAEQHMPSCEMRMLAAKLSGDMATSLRQASKAESILKVELDNACAPGTSCDNCSTQIIAAFKASE